VPLASVLLATHNDARYLPLAVESVLRQTLSDLELVVVDDASTDDTAELLSGISDSRLVVLRNDNQLGLAASLNRALDHAQGQYFARLDADDVALPDRLELQLARFRDLGVLGTAVLDLNEEGHLGTLHRNPLGPRAVRWLALFSSPFFHPTVLVAREALEANDLRYDSSYLESEDYELWTRLLATTNGANLADPLVLKRVHPGQASLRRSDMQKSFQRQVALREIARVAPELSAEERERAWAFGTGRSDSDREIYLALLASFERLHGVDPEVRQAAARTLGRFHPRLPLRRARRLVDQHSAHRQATSWLASLGRPVASVRVALVSPEPTPYRSPLLDRVAARPEIDLTVIYAARTVAARTWKVEPRHKSLLLSGVRLPGLRRALRHDYPLTPGIGRALRKVRPDVVVVSGWSTFASQAAIAWSRAHGIPYLLLVESHDLGPRARWRRFVKGAVVPRLVRGAAGVLVVGTAARESVLARGARRDRVRVFANTVDIEDWMERADRLPARSSDGDVVVLSVGRLVPEKGFDILLRATAQTGDERLRLVIAGAGPDADRLAELAKHLGVRLELKGDLPRDALAAEYVAADIFALLSPHEPWGVVVNEAAASGLPLVLSDRVGAAYDLLRDGENGFLVPAGDVAAAAAALGRLAADASLRHSAGARSRELVRDWGYELSVENFLAAVREATTAR
jgi:glycosyltransferase involved in cell wall biosynthesis